MKNILLSVALSTVIGSGSALAADIRIGTEGAYVPWNYIDDKGELAGYEIDLGREMCKRAKLSCEFVINEWDSIIPNLLAGNYDIIMAGMSVTDERKESINFSAEYYPPDPSRFAGATNVNADFDNLTGLKIGAQGATIQAAYVESNFAKGNTVLTFETPDQSIADLVAGNIDLLLADNSFLAPIVEGSAGAISFVGPAIPIGGGIAMGLRKSDHELAETMNAALESMKVDGTVDKLLLEYFEIDSVYAN